MAGPDPGKYNRNQFINVEEGSHPMYRCTDCDTPAPARTLFAMELGCYECGGALEEVGTAGRGAQPRIDEPAREDQRIARVA